MKNTILIVVETNANLADLTRRLVEAQGLGVCLTRRLQEACDLLSGSLDIVLLNAHSAAAAVRTALFGRNGQKPHILAVTTVGGSKEHVLELMEAGASFFMSGPASPKQILKEVHKIRKLLAAA